MKIAIIGAGFTGLSAAWELIKSGHEVQVYEKDSIPGGLAAGFKDSEWQWELEKHYHHIFSTDKAILQLLMEMGLSDLVFFQKTKTSLFYRNEKHQLDSPLSLLKFNPLSFINRCHVATVLASLKLNKKGVNLEGKTAAKYLKKRMGEKAWNILWKPLFEGKFGQYANEVNMAWFWARIFARSQKLGYFTGGFANLALQMTKKLQEKKVQFKFSSKVLKLKPLDGSWELSSKEEGKKKSNKEVFDKIIVTSTHPVLEKIVDLPKELKKQHNRLQLLAAQTLVIALKKPFFEDQTYWLNINENKWPFLAVVEQTNFIDKDKYGGNHLIYVAKYLKQSSKEYSLTKQQLLDKYSPFLKKLSSSYRKDLVKKTWLFKNDYAQPISKVNHSAILPQMELSLPGLYWSSMQHIYPFDRGVNYAVDFGRKVAIILEEKNE